jgi:hypothetical protein
MLRLSRVVLLLAVVIVASTGKAVTASQAGGDPVSGVAATDVQYELSTERPDLIVGVSVAVSPADVRLLQVRLYPEGQWTSCVITGAHAECRLASPVPVHAATELALNAS